jgi:UDP-N-acetylglucosamine--N-acetylmuramyl-(pentapeptide) pyrophosphoryl-undecaprenol N-acetylglucosamine transferase
MEQELVEREGILFQGIETGQVRGINPMTALSNSLKMVTGVRQSLALIAGFQPDVCFVTGGYVCAPVVVACRIARRRRVPVMVYLPDMMPGWAIRTLSLLAQRVAVSFPAAARYFGGEAPKGKAVATGYPVREELLAVTGNGKLDATAHRRNRQSMRQHLAQRLQQPTLAPDADGGQLPLVLVTGGSQGARNINRTIWAALGQLLPHTHILHLVGVRDWPLFETEAPLAELPVELSRRYHPVAYLHDEMALALAAADLAVARAGASTLGEFPLARLPAILVPLLSVNQQQNAEQLAQQGGALIIDDARLGEQLTGVLLALAQDEQRRHQMEEALSKLAQPDAAHTIALELAKLAAML